MDRAKELQKVLAEERLRSSEWREKYQTLKELHFNLREDYLTSQSELKRTLEHTKQLKDSKDDELNDLKGQLEEKTKQIDCYLNDLKDKEKYEEYYKEKCRKEFEDASVKMRKNLDQLNVDKVRLCSDNDKLKQKIVYLEQEIEIKLRNLNLEYQNEMHKLEKERDDLKLQFKDAKKHPDYEKLIKLENENHELKEQINNLHNLVNDADDKYRRIDDERDRLINEQNIKLKKLEKELMNNDLEYGKQKQEYQQLKSKLENCENQLRNLKSELQDSRSIRENLIAEHSNELKRKQKEKDELQTQLNEEKIKYELEIDKIKQEKKSEFCRTFAKDI